MPGAKSTVPTMTMNAAVVSFVSPVCGARREIPAVMHERCAGWWRNAPLTSAGTIRIQGIELWNMFLR
jgi:hypothetical protein